MLIKDIIDIKVIDCTKRLFMKITNSLALYESDGSLVFCSDSQSEDLYQRSDLGETICNQKDSWIVCKEAMNKGISIEKKCAEGILVFATPILYNEQVIGCIVACLINSCVSLNLAHNNLENAYKLVKQQLEMTSIFISSLYSAKLSNQHRQQKEHLEAIIENLDDAIFIYDSEKKYYLVNKVARSYFPGYDFKVFGEAYHTYKYFNLLNEEIRIEDLIISRVFKGEVVQNEKLSIRNNDFKRYINVNGKPIFDKEGNLLFAIILSRDITNDIENQNTIENHISELNALIDNMIDGVVIADIKGNILRMNNAALTINGLNQLNEPISIKNLSLNYDLINYDGVNVPLKEWPISKALNGKSISSTELWVHNKLNNSKVLCSYNATPIFNKDGDMILAIVTIRDITESRRQQQKLLTAEKEKNEILENSIKVKDEFLSLISHEFKTPLAVINTAIQAMELCVIELPNEARSFLNIIRQNTYRQLRLVNNILDVTIARSGRLKLNKRNIDIVALTNLIIESICPYASDKGIKVSFKTSLKCKAIGVDGEKYERILLNLLSNAIKFTPSGKNVTVLLRLKGKYISLEVRDTGVGIPRDMHQVIFEKFGQVDSSLSRNTEGTGFGLTLVKMLVEEHGGQIKLRSQIGKGSTFNVMIPASLVPESAPNEISNENSKKQLSTLIEFSDIYIKPNQTISEM